LAKKRVHEIAKQQGLTSKEVLAALQAAGVEAKAAASSVEEDVALQALKSSGGGDGAGVATAAPAKQAAAPKAAAKPAGDGAGAASQASKPVRPVRPPEGGAP